MSETSLHPPGGKSRKLTTLMIVNISILAIVGFLSILIMLFGDFDGKGVRVASTFLVFAAFTAFTAWDSSENRPSWHLPIGQTGNIYMLALSLVQIWATLGQEDRYWDEYQIFMNVLIIIFLVKAGVLIVQKIADLIFVEQQTLSTAAKVAAGAFGAATVLYSLPAGLEWLVDFREGYWKLSTAVLLLAGLALSITVMLAWFFKDKTPDVGFAKVKPKAAPVVNSPVQNREDVRTENIDAPIPAPAPEQNVKPGAPQFAPPVSSPLTWPVFPSGLPLPAKPNGRPDFDALEQIAKTYANAERQWFGQ